MKRAKFLLVLGGVLTIGVLAQAAFGKEIEEIIPFGINNPFAHPDSDGKKSESCLREGSILTLGDSSGKEPSYEGGISYVERHIEVDALKGCIPNGVNYMNNITDIGIDIISRYFTRRYCEEDCTRQNGLFDYKDRPYFGLEEGNHRNHEVAVQLYINGFNHYFWAAIEPASTKGYTGDIGDIGDIDITTHKTIKKDVFEGNQLQKYLPNSKAGFNEWKKWLNAMFDYLDAHNATDKLYATDKLLYIQLGNESDGDYAKKENPCPTNRDHYYWAAYAKLVESAYDVIKSRAVPQARIVIGTMGASRVSIEGFQKPVLEYLAGKIDENGVTVNTGRRCGGTGCFDDYDYHDFSGYKEYRGKEIDRSIKIESCDSDIPPITKNPQTFRQLLNEAGFSDKGLVVQQGGTYTGQDKNEKGEIKKEYQTEEDQAAYLVKRAVYLSAHGVNAAQFGTYIEHFGYKGSIHNWFTLMGLTYNGIPEKHCDGQLPCPDPGLDVKKLSWFSYKKLIDILKDADWHKVESLIDAPDPKDPESQTVFAYKFIKRDTQKSPAYVVWQDWWKGCPRGEEGVQVCVSNNQGNHSAIESCINNITDSCVQGQQPVTATIAVSEGVYRVKITEATPQFTTGGETEQLGGYETAFRSEEKKVDGGKVEVILGRKPLYIEEINDTSPPAVPYVSDEGEFTTRINQLSCSWTSEDPESGIAEYQYQITQDAPYGTIIREWTSTGTGVAVTATGLSLQDGKTYYFGVKAKNWAGLWSEAGYSDGITVDSLAPTITNRTQNPQRLNQALLFQAEVRDESYIVPKGDGGLKVELEVPNQRSNQRYPMKYNSSNNFFEAALPARAKPTVISYRILATDKAGNVAEAGEFKLWVKNENQKPKARISTPTKSGESPAFLRQELI